MILLQVASGRNCSICVVLLILALITATSAFRFHHSAVRRPCRTVLSMTDNSQQDQEYHVPVMLEECLEHLNIKPGGVYIDCTLGGGGHSKAILDRGGYVIGLDQDSDAIARARIVCKDYLEQGKMEIFQTNFRNAVPVVQSQSKLLQDGNVGGVDGVLMDLGISSYQIDEASRGFAFGADGPLDMRMKQSEGVGAFTAATIVNEWDVERIADILYEYGDETNSRKIASRIVSSRPHVTTNDLKKAISSVTSYKRMNPTLARCFQALRIVVNDEMAALDDTFDTIHKCVVPGGRLVTLSYHSLEGRAVKNLIKKGTPAQLRAFESRKMQLFNPKIRGPWKQLAKKAQSPTDEEVRRNKRARSAMLRVAERKSDDEFDEFDSEDVMGSNRVKIRRF